MKSITITELDELSIRKYHEQGIQTMFFYKNDYRYIYQARLKEDSNNDLFYFYACLGIPDYVVSHVILDNQLCSLKITKKNLFFYKNGCFIGKQKNDCISIFKNFKKIEKAFESVSEEELNKIKGLNLFKDKFRLFF